MKNKGKVDFSNRFNTALRRSQYSELSLSKLAIVFSVSKPTVHKWKTNNAIPKNEIFISVCKKLNVSSEWLAFGVGSPEHSSLYSKEEVYLIEMFRNLKQQEAGKKIYKKVIAELLNAQTDLITDNKQTEFLNIIKDTEKK